MSSAKYNPHLVDMSYENRQVRLVYPEVLGGRIKAAVEPLGLAWPDFAGELVNMPNNTSALREFIFELEEPERLGPALVSATEAARLYEHHQHMVAPSWGRTKIYLDCE